MTTSEEPDFQVPREHPMMLPRAAARRIFKDRRKAPFVQGTGLYIMVGGTFPCPGGAACFRNTAAGVNAE